MWFILVQVIKAKSLNLDIEKILISLVVWLGKQGRFGTLPKPGERGLVTPLKTATATQENLYKFSVPKKK